MEKTSLKCKDGLNPKKCRSHCYGHCYGCDRFDLSCPNAEDGAHTFEHIGTSGNPYEGGTVYSKCSKCGVVKGHSEDGPEYHEPGYTPYFRTIADDLRSVGINPETADDLTIERFLGSNR
jgi:hypothetical protein